MWVSLITMHLVFATNAWCGGHANTWGESTSASAPDRRDSLSLSACTSPVRQSISLTYRSRQPSNDVARMGREADQVFGFMRKEAERRGFGRVFVWPTDPSGISLGFSYYRQTKGSWDRAPVQEANNYPSASPEGAPLTPAELDQLRQAVSTIPDLRKLEDVPVSGVCAAADTGFIPTRLTIGYVDQAFGVGDRRKFEAVTRAVREEAEGLSVSEAYINVYYDGKSAAHVLRREKDGSWRAPVQIEP